MNKTIKNIHWYLDESITNMELYKKHISLFVNNNASFIEKWFWKFNKEFIKKKILEWQKWNINIDNETIDFFKKWGLMCSLDNQTKIFTFTLLKSLVISYFSIFEHFINNIWSEIWLVKWLKNWKSIKEDFTEFLKRIFKYFWYWDIVSVVNIETYKWFTEFWLRRNLYVHEYWIITEKYLDDFKRYQLDTLISDFNKKPDTFKVWEKLYLDPFYLTNVWNRLNSIWIVVSIFYLFNRNKDRKDILKWLKLISDYLIDNEYYYTYVTIFLIIEKFIDLNWYEDFILWYLFSINKFTTQFWWREKTQNMVDEIYNNAIKSISIEKFNDFQKIQYLCLINNDNEALSILKQCLQKKSKFNVNMLLNYEYLCNFLINNQLDIKKIFKMYNISFSLNRNINIKNLDYIKEINKIYSNNSLCITDQKEKIKD